LAQNCSHPHYPSCFGSLDHVFPPGPEGLREVPEKCTLCSLKVDCLHAAVNQGQGAREMREHLAKREQEQIGGVAGFMRRWARLKAQKKGGK
jgi:hypothetical protein